MLPAMFGMGGSEILVILIVALLFLGPEKLPEAAKQISKGIRDIKKQSRVLQRTIEDDEHIGGAIRDLKSALRGEDEPIRPHVIKPRDPLAATATATATATSEADDATALLASSDAAPAALPEAEATSAPALRMPPTAGQQDASVPATTADDDAALAALVRPAPDTIARAAPGSVEPAVAEPADPSGSSHG